MPDSVTAVGDEVLEFAAGLLEGCCAGPRGLVVRVREGGGGGGEGEVVEGEVEVEVEGRRGDA